MGDADGASRSFIEQARRAQIVAAAIETLAEVGFSRTTFARIARTAGVSPALISYHFDDKEELLTEVVRTVEASMDGAMTAELTDVESYTAALRGVLISFAAYVAAHPAQMLALGEIYANGSSDSPAHRHARATRATTIDELAEMLADGQRDGELGRFDPHAVATALYATLGSIPATAQGDARLDPIAYGRELADLFERATRA